MYWLGTLVPVVLLPPLEGGEPADHAPELILGGEFKKIKFQNNLKILTFPIQTEFCKNKKLNLTIFGQV